MWDDIWFLIFEQYFEIVLDVFIILMGQELIFNNFQVFFMLIVYRENDVEHVLVYKAQVTVSSLLYLRFNSICNLFIPFEVSKILIQVVSNDLDIAQVSELFLSIF